LMRHALRLMVWLGLATLDADRNEIYDGLSSKYSYHKNS